MKASEGYKTHPAWGMIQFSRGTFSGIKRLFGSSLERHGTTITLRIWQAQRKHDLGEDWLMAAHGPILAEVEMSAAQFAGLLTTMNIGHGVPCTIHRIDGRAVEEMPEDKREVERVRESFEENLRTLALKLTELLKQAGATLERKDLKAADRKDLRDRIRSIVQDIESGMPFMLQQFERATDKITTAAKAEVDAFITQTATTLGLDRLREMAAFPSPQLADHGTAPADTDPLLPSTDDPCERR